MDRQNRSDAKAMVEAILESPIVQRPENAELLTLMLRLNASLEAPVPFGLQSTWEILRVANTLEDQQSVRQFVRLAVLFYPLTYLLFRDMVAGSLDNIIKSLIETHFTDVAIAEFKWLEEIKDMGHSTEEMLIYLQDTVSNLQNSGPWVTSDDANPEGDHPGELDPNLHQHHCVHEGGPPINQLRTLATSRPEFDWERCNFHRNETLRVVSAYCGLAGVIPDWKTGKILTGRVVFRGSGASVWFSGGQEQLMVEMTPTKEVEWQGEIESGSDRGFSGKGKLRELQDPSVEAVSSHENKTTSKEHSDVTTEGHGPPLRTPQGIIGYDPSSDNLHSTVNEGKRSRGIAPPTQPLSSAQTLKMQHNQGYTLTGSEIKIIELLKQATTRLCSAAKVLQKEGFCCNAFTLVISREPSNLRGHVLDLVSISFQTLKDLRDAVSALRIEPTGRLPSVQREDLIKCSAIGLRLLCIFASMSTLESVHRGSVQDWSVNSHLHICSLAAQFLGLGLVFYAQAHQDPYSPFFLEDPLAEINLTGTMDSGFYIKAWLQELTCLGEMVDGFVFVFKLSSTRPIPSRFSLLPATPLDLCGRGIDIADTWGPGLLISRPGAAYGQQVYAIEIGGGVIRRVESQGIEEDLSEPLYHWSPRYDHYEKMRNQATFSCWDGIRIGGIRIRSACPLDAERCRKQSQQILSNLGTATDYWELAERQVAFQAGYYAVLQLGKTYVRKFGITVKQQIIQQWSLMPNMHMLDVLWGLQVSLCTGVARRVSLLTLIEGSLFTHIDTLQYDQWQKMLPKAQEAFRGSIDFGGWIEGLNANEKSCLIAIIAYVLGLLKHTGVNREDDALSVLWPHKSNESYGIKLGYDDRNLWTQILRDSESCATFAAVTSLCFEGHNYKCRNLAVPLWQEAGAFLSTAVCRDLTAGKSMEGMSSKLQLEDGQKYWVGKIGSKYLVVVRKTKDGDMGLFVRYNRLPKMVSQKVLRWQVIRERPDVTFDAEDVLVFGDESGL